MKPALLGCNDNNSEMKGTLLWTTTVPVATMAARKDNGRANCDDENPLRSQQQ
jgi:hypothetical protein